MYLFSLCRSTVPTATTRSSIKVAQRGCILKRGYTQYDITRRPRRLRLTPAIRRLVQETTISCQDLVMPLFVVDGEGDPQPISSMPDQFRFPISKLLKECEELCKLNIKAVALFPCIESGLKNPEGTHALDPNTLVLRAIRSIKKHLPELVLIADIALDPYTSHGHDGVLNAQSNDIDNDNTISILTEMATLNATAGVDFIAPSDMMDGRIGIIRQALDIDGFQNTGIISYSAKYSSAYYGPFRDAVGSAQKVKLNKSTYQMDPANRREALIETQLDAQEGADVLLVKPAGPYLDIIRELRNATFLPVAGYQVSGEYSQIHAAAEKGWLSLPHTRNESLLSIKRAGADIIFTYFAKEYAQMLRQEGKSDI